MLKLCEDGWRNDDLLEQLGKYVIDAAQNEIVERRGIRDDHAHECGRIFSRVAWSASKSVSA